MSTSPKVLEIEPNVTPATILMYNADDTLVRVDYAVKDSPKCNALTAAAEADGLDVCVVDL